MAHLGGRISYTKLPPHCGLMVSLAFFKVDGPESDAPYRGDPPADAAKDCPEIYNNVNLDVELLDESRDIPFSIEHPTGYYFIQVRSILYRKNKGKVLAQVEPFFFGRRPLPLLQDLPSVTLPIEWPSIPIEKLEHYGTFTPQNPGGG